MEDETTSLYFGQSEVTEGIGPDTRDKYLRTLIRNTYNYHMNEIFATVQNEYIDWTVQGPLEAEPPIRPRHLQMATSKALTDKLFLAPILSTANWCNQSGFQTWLYIYAFCDSASLVRIRTDTKITKIQSFQYYFVEVKKPLFYLKPYLDDTFFLNRSHGTALHSIQCLKMALFCRRPPKPKVSKKYKVKISSEAEILSCFPSGSISF